MNTKLRVNFLTETHFTISPIWKFIDGIDLYEPIFSPEDIPDDSRDLRIKAEFTTPSGIKFFGYVVGVQNFFSIAFFINGKNIHFNKNAVDLSLEQFDELSKAFLPNKNIKIPDIFPAKFTTMINLPGWKNISGEFDAFEKLKDKRLLRWKNI